MATSPEFQALLERLRNERDAANETTARQSDAARARWLGQVHAALAGQRRPKEQADDYGDKLLAAAETELRDLIGRLPYAYTEMGTVISVDTTSGTFRARFSSDALAPTGVPAQRPLSYGETPPRVGQTIPCHFPVVLPRTPQSLTSGPIPDPEHLPWGKVPGGQTWIYYLGFNDGTERFAVYRAALPPMDDLAFTYDPRTILHLGDVQPFAAGDDPPHNLVATYANSLIWTDVHHWETQPTPEDAPSTLPWPTNLHRYKEFGTFGPPSQTTDVRPSNPHVAVHGSNLDPAAPSDYLLGISAYSEQVPEIPSTPLTPEQRGKDILFDLAWSDGGGSWSVVKDRFYSFKNIWLFFAAGGFYQVRVAWQTAVLQGASGWVADSPTPWGPAGARVHVWAVQERDAEPYPADVRLNGDDTLSRPLFAGYLSSNIPLIRYYVSQNGSPATRNLLPLPVGWLGTAQQATGGYAGSRCFWCGTLGGQRLWAWWLGHGSQSADPVTLAITATPTHLWYGEGNQDGNGWIWEVREPADVSLETVQAVNRDGSVLIASAFTDPGHSARVYFISEDVGAHWRTLPAPPFWDDAFSAHQLWLVDTP